MGHQHDLEDDKLVQAVRKLRLFGLLAQSVSMSELKSRSGPTLKEHIALAVSITMRWTVGCVPTASNTLNCFSNLGKSLN